jgi:hypothetical protein
MATERDNQYSKAKRHLMYEQLQHALEWGVRIEEK